MLNFRKGLSQLGNSLVEETRWIIWSRLSKRGMRAQIVRNSSSMLRLCESEGGARLRAEGVEELLEELEDVVELLELGAVDLDEEELDEELEEDLELEEAELVLLSGKTTPSARHFCTDSMLGVSSRNSCTERKISRQSSPKKSVKPRRGLGFTGRLVIQLIASCGQRRTR